MPDIFKSIAGFIVTIIVLIYKVIQIVIGAVVLVFALVFMPIADHIQIGNDAGYALRDAVQYNNRQAVIEAIEDGADPNNLRNDGKWCNSPLAYAAEQEAQVSVNTLLEYDIDPNLNDKKGETVFIKILENDEAFSALLPKADLSCKSKKGRNIISLLLKDDVWKIKAVIDEGAEVTAENITEAVNLAEDKPAIHDVYLIKLLIDNYKGEIPAENSSLSSLYSAFKGNYSGYCEDDLTLYAITAGCSGKTLEKYIDDETDIDTLVRIAIACSNIDTTEYLISIGADLSYNPDKNGKLYYNALKYAVEYGDMPILEYVFSENNEAMNDCFKIAAECGSLEKVKYLIENGADSSYVPAFEAALKNSGDSETVKYFIEKGFDVNLPGSWGDKCFSSMFSYCGKDLLELAYNSGGSLTEEEMLRAAYNAAIENNLEGFEFLKDIGCNNFNDSYWESGVTNGYPLFAAVEYGYFDIVKFLVENGASAEGYSEYTLEEFKEKAEMSRDIYSYLTSAKII